jgi:hypothetical protein
MNLQGGVSAVVTSPCQSLTPLFLIGLLLMGIIVCMVSPEPARETSSQALFNRTLLDTCKWVSPRSKIGQFEGPSSDPGASFTLQEPE